jgi:Ca-activated chloride channel family protein
LPELIPPSDPIGRNQFAHVTQNGFKVVREAPISTFSNNVDTASYSSVRASSTRNVPPQADSVRTKEPLRTYLKIA